MKRKISILKEYCNSIGRDHDEIQYSVVLPCIVEETEKEIDQILSKYKRNDKTKEQLVQYLVDGIAIGTPEKIIKGLNEYVDIGVNHFIMHFKGLNNITLKLFHSKIISKI